MTQPAPQVGEQAADGQLTLARQGIGFLVSGVIVLSVDMGVTSALTRLVGLSAYLARPIAIACAMVVAFMLHRTLTFRVTTPPTLFEFLRYAAVALTTAVANYAVYAVLLLMIPSLAPEVALFLSSLVAMSISFVGMKFGVFHRGRA